ncbi:MAG: hypothetical protein AM325_008575 [Candidatus Thorarchaeota archaeon SMTZ1-45]|nr:MAG: hypothetical protein AM325_10290 [Candidatus Thorarchaeota archaeon SMTZ1-45]
MNNEITTHLQALYNSGQISEYILARLPVGMLKTGWIEQGLISKGMKGNLRDKNNQESLIIPADRFSRLSRDRAEWDNLAILIIGPKGLTAKKFVAMVFGPQDSQCLVAFQTQKISPYEIMDFLIQNALGEKLSGFFEEPNLDYVEQLRLDASEGELAEMTVLSLPKKQMKISEWMKEVLLSPSSDSIEAQHGKSNKIPKFAALVTRWLTGLELFKNTSNGIASLVFWGPNIIDACFWDQPQRISAFIIFNHNNLDLLTTKYLTPLWIAAGESNATIQPTREVTVEPRKVSVSTTKQSTTEKYERSIALSKSDLDSIITDLTKRLDSLESHLRSSIPASEMVEKNRGTMDVLHSRLLDNIERIESLSKRLFEIEKRLKRIQT